MPQRSGKTGPIGAFKLTLASALLGCSALASAAAQAAEFHLFLKCAGTLSATGKSKPAHLHLALRDNNTTALIQRSNVLPMGERLRYTRTPTDYTMVYKLRRSGGHHHHDWVNGAWVIWQPDLKRMATIRMAIDRAEGQLEGELLDFNDDRIGALQMTCSKVDQEALPEPQF